MKEVRAEQETGGSSPKRWSGGPSWGAGTSCNYSINDLQQKKGKGPDVFPHAHIYIGFSKHSEMSIVYKLLKRNR